MKFRSIAALGAVLFLAFAGRAQTTAFTYQGQLSSNNVPANGLYDFRFRLTDVGDTPDRAAHQFSNRRHKWFLHRYAEFWQRDF